MMEQKDERYLCFCKLVYYKLLNYQSLKIKTSIKFWDFCRIRRTAELLTYIRTLKMYGWELLFSTWLMKTRSSEVKYLAVRDYLFLLYSIPILVGILFSVVVNSFLCFPFNQTRKYLDAWCVFFWATTPTLFSFCTFGLYSLMGHQLDAATVC